MGRCVGATMTPPASASGDGSLRVRRGRHWVTAGLVVAGIGAAAATVVVAATGGAPTAAQRVQIVVSTTPELSCDIGPDVVLAGIRHIDVRMAPAPTRISTTTPTPAAGSSTGPDTTMHNGGGPVTVRLVRDAGQVVFEVTATDTDNGEPAVPEQEMARLTAGSYTLHCRLADASVQRHLQVTNP